MRLEELPEPSVPDEFLPEPVVKSQVVPWEKDMEMWSKFLERKVLLFGISYSITSLFNIFILEGEVFLVFDKNFSEFLFNIMTRILSTHTQKCCECGKQDDLKADSHAYVRQRPELNALLDDFLQLLLTQKPADPVAFAREYFSSFSCKTRQWSILDFSPSSNYLT